MNDQYGKNIFPFIQTNVCLDKEGYKYQKKRWKIILAGIILFSCLHWQQKTNPRFSGAYQILQIHFVMD